MNITISHGNTKLPRTTMIMNMGTAEHCPSKIRGLCDIASKCYARKSEKLYPNVLPARKRQAKYWLSNTAEVIAADLLQAMTKNTTLFRFNESGDFYSQKCVEKLDKISRILFDKRQVITYGYTARKDLDFSSVYFRVKGSGHNQGNNGMAIVVKKNQNIPAGFVQCSGSCRACDLCSKANNKSVAFIQH